VLAPSSVRWLCSPSSCVDIVGSGCKGRVSTGGQPKQATRRGKDGRHVKDVLTETLQAACHHQSSRLHHRHRRPPSLRGWADLNCSSRFKSWCVDKQVEVPSRAVSVGWAAAGGGVKINKRVYRVFTGRHATSCRRDRHNRTCPVCGSETHTPNQNERCVAENVVFICTFQEKNSFFRFIFGEIVGNLLGDGRRSRTLGRHC
jgi:hypothetical protein